MDPQMELKLVILIAHSSPPEERYFHSVLHTPPHTHIHTPVYMFGWEFVLSVVCWFGFLETESHCITTH